MIGMEWKCKDMSQKGCNSSKFVWCKYLCVKKEEEISFLEYEYFKPKFRRLHEYLYSWMKKRYLRIF
jgi:hypothetical protein